MFNATGPARLAETVPLWPSNAATVLVSVPFCTVPPWKLTVPEVVCEFPPRSKTPDSAVMLPLVGSALDTPSCSVPPLTVVPPA